ncbi:MAG: CaiB/BaiF CoA-transferase family protein [Pseudomonadota bacterium]
MDEENKGPLSGVVVLELAHVMAGPTCGRILADLGASVIKLERLEGEDCRRMAPPWQGDEAAGFLMLNRNKKGIAVNLKTPGGLRVLFDLVAKSDVLIENFRKGALEKLGADYDSLKGVNPGLIFCEISGFGRTGPYAERGGFDLVAQAMSGVLSVTGEGEGRPPVKAGVPVADIGAGMFAAIGVLAALNQRNVTGRGQRVDTSLFEAAAAFMTWPAAMHFAGAEPAVPMGTAHPLDAPYQAFEASDGWFIVGAANQANWLRLVSAINAPHLLEDARFTDNPARVANLEALVESLSAIFIDQPKSHWIDLLEKAGVPTGPINSVAEMIADPQIRARGMVTSTVHKTLGEVDTLNTPLHFSDSETTVRAPAPVLGEHTNDILGALGYDKARINELEKSGAILADKEQSIVAAE